MAYLWLKAFHVISIIALMAGLLYIFRLFVYHAMEEEAVVRQRFEVMERRLMNFIVNPALFLTLGTGIGLILMMPELMKQPWFHIKLTALLGIFASHGIASKYRKKLIENPKVKSDKFFRIMNEVPTVMMIVIVIAVIVKPFAK